MFRVRLTVPGRPRWLPIALAVACVLSLPAPLSSGTSVAPSAAPAGVPGSAAGPMSAPPPTNISLAVNESPINLSAEFWGTTINNEVHVLRGETNALNATPSRVLVWPGAMAGEDYDPFTDTHYQTDDGVPSRALTNESQFVTMCKAIRCTAIVQVPAEIDNASFGEAVVNYTERNLSFTPAYWMIGNEPELWEHWKVPWSEWGSDYTSGPTPSGFGHEVMAYVKAIREVDTTTPILGLPASGCSCSAWTFAQWIAGVLNVTGNKIQAVAFHEYPAGWLGTGNGSLEAFYGTIQSAANIPIRIVAARAAVRTACPGCNVSVFVSELGAALSYSDYGQYAAGFSGALSIASQLTQAMADNLTNVDLFAAELNTTNSWFNTGGVARPDYALYTQILDHLGTQAFEVNVTGLGKTLYGIDTVAPGDGGRRDLLVMNDNITHAITFTPAFARYAGTTPVEAWSWAGTIRYSAGNATNWVEPSTPNPVAADFPEGLPASYTLPPQAMVLFETFPSAPTYVRLNETGVPTGVAWFASLGGVLHTTTASNLSLLVPGGTYSLGGVPIPLPIGGKEHVPSEQLSPFPTTPAVVAGPSTNLSLDFVPQWRVDASASPSEGGVVAPDVEWANASEPVRLTETPLAGYAFAGWSGWGPGSYNGSGRVATVVPTGRITETARFVPGDEVVFWETGLPADTAWSVTVRGLTTSSTTNLLAVYEPNGVFGYSVTPVPGYRILPRNSSVTVEGTGVVVDVRFQPITPPGLVFPVTFQVTGLPGWASVPITVRGQVQTAGSDPPRFQLWNGSYAYRVGYVPGYHVASPRKTFVVGGGPLTVIVPFVRTVYGTAFAASGSRAGWNWSVSVNGTTFVAGSAWLSASFPNGSYPFTVSLPSNYSVTPRTGVLGVDGAPVEVPLVFTLLDYPAGFEVVGGTAAGGWSVRLGNLTRETSSGRLSFLDPNGSYTYDVRAPNGDYAVPSHGRLTVSGPTSYVIIRIHPSSLAPSAALVAALSSTALTVSLWIGGSAFVGFAAVRWLRRRGG